MNRIPASISSRSSLQQPDDLRRHGDVERLGDVVADQEARLGDQRVDDHRPLQHAARILVRELVVAARGGRDADPIEQGHDALFGVAPADLRPDGAQLLRDLHADRDGRIERAAGVGADIADVPAAQGQPLGIGHGEQVAAAEQRPGRSCARAAAGSSRPAALASVVLPEPLSPITPSTCRSATVKPTSPSTGRRSLPRCSSTDRPLTSSSGDAAIRSSPAAACCAPAPARRPSG